MYYHKVEALSYNISMSTQTERPSRHQWLIADYTSAVTVILVMGSLCIHGTKTLNVCVFT